MMDEFSVIKGFEKALYRLRISLICRLIPDKIVVLFGAQKDTKILAIKNPPTLRPRLPISLKEQKTYQSPFQRDAQNLYDFESHLRDEYTENAYTDFEGLQRLERPAYAPKFGGVGGQQYPNADAKMAKLIRLVIKGAQGPEQRSTSTRIFLQERFFSHRLLYFTDKQVYFQCRRNTWCEDTVLELDNPQLHLEDQTLCRFGIPIENDVGYPDSLTYEGDLLNAFGGIFREIYRRESVEPQIQRFSISGSHLHGSGCSLWYPQGTGPVIERDEKYVLKIRNHDRVFAEGSHLVITRESRAGLGLAGLDLSIIPMHFSARVLVLASPTTS
ncbi:hypothetical protein GJ744_010825 [Endocarpon pusillum]|uniref:Uncharacterized protein n=1 Tax=Endocarpon pusillum TaxID=364733 RepID=A0A8H7E2R9_9EURO|nr:hypothetical protein GJ744_010825 [Endocarpon pusillum]